MAEHTEFKQNIASLWQRFETWEIPIHSLLAAQNGKLLWETYRPPYQSDTLHRMFSITKSFCALAAGCLAAAGKLDLDAPIVRFFPEYLPPDGAVHPYLNEMTIRHMLAMQTCHSATTYKLNPEKNWVESFFSIPPTHKSGQIFLYDTSSSHTLAALVKRLTGMGVLDYLRTCFLDDIGFSREAYIINDPFGAEMGGSGLMARPRDLMVTAQYLMKQYKNGAGAFAGYLRAAVSRQVPTLHSGQTIDEQQGYGYQFWRIRNGFAMYGMGGQYVLFYPEPDIILVITADSQNIKGGSQKILDAVYQAIAPYYSDIEISAAGMTGHTADRTRAAAGDICKRSAGADGTDLCPVISGSTDNSAAAANGRCRLLPNKGGFTELMVSGDSNRGMLTLKHPDAVYRIPFGWGNLLQTAILTRYNQPIASSGKWLDEHSLFIYTQLVGECVGSLSFMLRFRPDGLTLWMKKTAETMFEEFCDFAEGLWIR